MPHSLALHEAMVMSPGVELEERNKTKRGEKALANRDTMSLYRSVPVSRICSQDKRLIRGPCPGKNTRPSKCKLCRCLQ